MEEKKIGYWEELKEGRIFKSSTRMNAFLALAIALGLSVAAVFMDDITLGDSLPFVGTLLGYSLGSKAFKDIASRSVK